MSRELRSGPIKSYVRWEQRIANQCVYVVSHGDKLGLWEYAYTHLLNFIGAGFFLIITKSRHRDENNLIKPPPNCQVRYGDGGVVMRYIVMGLIAAGCLCVHKMYLISLSNFDAKISCPIVIGRCA